MHRFRWIGVLAMGVAISCFASCGGTDDAASGGGPSSTSSTGEMASSGGGSGGGGAGGGVGGSSSSFCADATPIEFGGVIEGDLAIVGQQDHYRFAGKKGQVVYIDIDAQYLNKTNSDPTVIDSVVTLFDDLGNQIARNDNPIEYSTVDSRLYTILPADGDYCISVSECWTSVPNPAQNCAGEKDKLVTKYMTWLYEFVDEPGDAFVAETEVGDTAADATKIDYVANADGYYLTTFWGTFRDAQDVDVYSFTVPADYVLPPNTRLTGYFYFTPHGSDENGSTATMANVWIVDPNAPDQVLAEVDATLNHLFVPRLEVGKPYLLFVTRTPKMSQENDFYFVRHYALGSAPIELEQGIGQNDTFDKAESIAINQQTNRGYLEGDITMAPADVDHFKATVPPGMTTVRAVCGGRYLGSGLRELKLSLLDTNGNPLTATSSDVDEQSRPAQVPYVPVGDNAQVIVRVEAGQQDPTIAQAFYGCAVMFAP